MWLFIASTSHCGCVLCIHQPMWLCSLHPPAHVAVHRIHQPILIPIPVQSIVMCCMQHLTYYSLCLVIWSSLENQVFISTSTPNYNFSKYYYAILKLFYVPLPLRLHILLPSSDAAYRHATAHMPSCNMHTSSVAHTASCLHAYGPHSLQPPCWCGPAPSVRYCWCQLERTNYIHDAFCIVMYLLAYTLCTWWLMYTYCKWLLNCAWEEYQCYCQKEVQLHCASNKLRWGCFCSPTMLCILLVKTQTCWPQWACRPARCVCVGMSSSWLKKSQTSKKLVAFEVYTKSGRSYWSIALK